MGHYLSTMYAYYVIWSHTK